jgi:hypothetical protein
MGCYNVSDLLNYGGTTMRCRSCDEALTDYESTRKSLSTGEYINLCKDCFESIKYDCLAFGNPSLMTDDDDIYSNGTFGAELFDTYDEDNDRD